MDTRKHVCLTFTAVAAVLAIVTWLSGCATPRHMDELRLEVEQIQQQNRDTHRKLSDLDSTMSREAEGNRRMRADVNVTVDQLEQQIATLQESYNDLLQKVDAIYRAVHERRVLRGSPGVEPGGSESPTGQPPSEGPAVADVDCSASYDEAFILVRRGEYEKAIGSFEVFLEECPGHELGENAHYWIGESYYSLERHEQAIEEFEFLLNNYRGSVNASRALYKLGRSKQELGRAGEARTIFQRLVDEHPGTLEAEQAKERLKELN